MARNLEARIRRLERLYAYELAQVTVDNFLEFVDVNWYRYAASKKGNGLDFIRLAGLHRSGLPRTHKVADYLDDCADFNEFPDPHVIAKTLLPRRR